MLFKKSESVFKLNNQAIVNETGNFNTTYIEVPFQKYASIIDLSKSEHLHKLEEMLSPNSQYIIYSSIIDDPKKVEAAMDVILTEKAKKYIERVKGWRLPRDYVMRPFPEITFGELYVVMKFAGQTARIKLEDFEKL